MPPFPMRNSIGKRIKTLRQRRNLTLTEMAEAAHLSPSHLSQIERDKATPSLSTLSNIAIALDVSLRDLFEAEADQIHITQASQRPATKLTAAATQRKCLTNPTSRWNLEVERLSLFPDTPGLEYGPFPGEVLGFVVEGALRITVDGEQYDLEAGDSIHYEANRSYRLSCLSHEPCTVIWCKSPPQRHAADKDRAGDQEESTRRR